MGHHITAIVTPHAFRSDIAERLDLDAVSLTPSLTLFHVMHATDWACSPPAMNRDSNA